MKKMILIIVTFIVFVNHKMLFSSLQLLQETKMNANVLPSGSYKQSCFLESCIKTAPSTLQCICKTGSHKGIESSTLNFASCKAGSIDNDDGILVCTTLHGKKLRGRKNQIGPDR